ncbi:MAG: phosphocholine cytidylyltransferase family protein [Chloroflexota bacterium]
MDALIMAAGRGSRLGAHTDDRPKSLIDLGGISPLELQIDVLASRGIERVLVVTGYRREDVVTAAIARAAGRLKVQPIWNPFWPVTNVIGSAWMAREHLTTSFVYLHADTVFEPTILDDLLATPGDGVLPIDFRPCEPEQMKASVVDGRVTHLSKELGDGETAGEFIGIGLFREPALGPVRAGLDAVLAEGTLNAYFEGALNHAIDAGLDLRTVATAGRAWTEIDFEADLELARSILPRLLPAAST